MRSNRLFPALTLVSVSLLFPQPAFAGAADANAEDTTVGNAPGPPATLIIDIEAIQSSSLVILNSPQLIDLKVQICTLPESKGVALGQPPSTLKLEPASIEPKWLQLTIAPAGRSCSEGARAVQLFFYQAGPWDVPQESVTIWFDSAVAELAAPDLQPFQLAAARGGEITATASCTEQKTCSIKLSDDFLKEFGSGSGKAGVVLWPVSIPLKVGELLPAVVKQTGERLDWKVFVSEPKTIIFNRPLVEAGKLDTAGARHELVSRFPEAIEHVSCDSAECRATRQGVLVFQIDPAAPVVKLRYTLKPRFLRKIKRKLLNSDMVTLRLERCTIKIPRETPLLAGAQNHRYFVKLPRECTTDEIRDLQIETRPPTRAYVKAEIDSDEPGMRLLEIMLDRVSMGVDRIELTLFERVGVLRRLGTARIPVASSYRPTEISLKIPEIGMVDFIPSNRLVSLRLGYSTPWWTESCTVEGRPGFYTVSRIGGNWTVRGEPGVTGSVPLRIAYRPQDAARFVGTRSGEAGPVMATFDTEASYAVKNINLPLPLLPEANQQQEFIKVICGGKDREQAILIGRLARIPYLERDSCRIVFDRDKIPMNAGAQRLRVNAGDFNQIIVLAPKGGKLTVAIPAGERTEYDTVAVTIAHDLLSGHYTLQSQQNLGEEARYRILLSDSWIRISATTALPTGMFRFGSGSVEGTVPISAGALARASYMQTNGRDFPLGLEAGLFGTNLSGQPDFSIVVGIGLSIPVLNPNTSLQASFNIHAWAEYAPTRVAREEIPLAFLFGPSFTVGRLSTTF